MRIRAAGMAAVVGLGLVLGGAAGRAQEAGGVPVGVAIATLKPVNRTAEFVGRIEAPERVDIRARVKGMLEAVLFTEGQMVTEGEPLFRIEKPLFEADVEAARGRLSHAQASLELAKLQRDRAQTLVDRNTGSVANRDQAAADEASARGDVLTAEAALKTAEINLGYTDITSPITGRIGRSTYTKGHIIGPESGPLALVVSQNPMYVVFPISQRDFLEARAQGAAGKGAADSLEVRVRFADGSTYGEVGRLNYIDVSVDRTTDTLNLRATLPNPDGALIDGQLVRVDLTVGKPEDELLIPQAALIADQAGLYVFVVEDGKAVVRRVKVSGQQGTDSIIAEGVKPGEPVIVDGFQNIRPGAAVRATPAASFGG